MNPADMTREELIDEVTRVRTLIANMVQSIEQMKIRQDDDYTFDPFIPEIPERNNVVRSRSGIPRYTCECGTEINITRKNRHEASAKHIRIMAQIKD